MKKTVFLLLTLLLIHGCTKVDQPTASSSAKRYPFKGKIVSMDPAKKKAAIAHEKIEGYMDAMTMEFPIHGDWVWKDITVGSEIHADLVVDSAGKEPYWLENVMIIAAGVPGDVPLNENFAQVGGQVPKVELTNQDGKKISFENFRGKALAVTFIYSRCPLPDYCIRMSTNFSDIANLVKNDPKLKDSIRLLSISFDPETDTPEKLRSYGTGYFGKGNEPDFNVWQLAVGTDAEVRRVADYFGLRYEVDPNDKTTINHSLRTAVIAPDGTLRKIYSGNEWTPQELLSEMESTLR